MRSLQDMLSLEELCSYLGFLFGLFRNNTETFKKQIIILTTYFQKRLIFHSTSHKTCRNLGWQKHVSLIKYENKIQMRALYFHSQIVMQSVEQVQQEVAPGVNQAGPHLWLFQLKNAGKRFPYALGNEPTKNAGFSGFCRELIFREATLHGEWGYRFSF